MLHFHEQQAFTQTSNTVRTRRLSVELYAVSKKGSGHFGRSLSKHYPAHLKLRPYGAIQICLLLLYYYYYFIARLC